MTRLHAGGKFGGGSYGASGGLHGVGASVVNALAIRMDVEVSRGGSLHLISFQRGAPGNFDSAKPDAKFSKKSGLRKGGKAPKKGTGTRIKYWSDPQIFLKEADYDITDTRVFAAPATFSIIKRDWTLLPRAE